MWPVTGIRVVVKLCSGEAGVKQVVGWVGWVQEARGFWGVMQNRVTSSSSHNVVVVTVNTVFHWGVYLFVLADTHIR